MKCMHEQTKGTKQIGLIFPMIRYHLTKGNIKHPDYFKKKNNRLNQWSNISQFK